MKTVKSYIKPETEIVMPRCTLLELDMVVHETFVDDEAANKGTFQEDDADDEFEPFFDEY